MKKIITIFILFTICLSSCSDDNKTPGQWWTGDGDGDGNGNGGGTTVSEKPRYIWIDAAANFPDYADSKENIARDMKKIKDTGFTDIVVDVRPTTGDVLFQTEAVDQVRRMGYWASTGYTLYNRTATWDYLQAFIDAGHAAGLKVHAAINTFTGGNTYINGLGSDGLLFRDSSKKKWATSLNTTGGIINVMDIAETRTKFFDPSNDEVQNFLLRLIGDLAKYDIDGIFLDRCRFDELESDFSDNSKTKFEAYIGSKVSNFPNDVVVPGTKTGQLPAQLPTHFKKWLEFRAKVIHDFVEKARNKVKSVNPKVQFGVYVGGWYSSYYGVGVNWASPKYDTSAYYSQWATADYKKYGYADHLDFLLLGAYASANRIYGTGEWTVQGFCTQAKTKFMGDVKFAGGPDVGNWNIPAGTDVHTAITNTVDAAYNAGDGYFLFDLIHLKQKPEYWDDVKRGIDKVLPVATNK